MMHPKPKYLLLEDPDPIRSNKTTAMAEALLSYLALGWFHELSHLLMAALLSGKSFWSLLLPGHGQGRGGSTLELLLFLVRTVLGRQCALPVELLFPTEQQQQEGVRMIRHAGWIFSVLLALALHVATRTCTRYKKNKKIHAFAKALVSAAYVTALEAVVTDLFQWTPLPTVAPNQGSIRQMTTFFCGNFGVILLNPRWSDNNFERALKILEQMIRITMIRGAQTGGVVTFEKSTKVIKIKAIRSRVLNRKRTDLSQKLIAQIKHDLYLSSLRGTVHSQNDNNRRIFAGHTRFATSSVADYEGTHPQQFSPRTIHRVYNFQTTGQCRIMGVENFVTHNGDFDYYTLNDTTSDLSTIQDWLVKIFNQPLPNTVDSNSIAGMMDILRTHGCFALSVRYVLCLGLPSCSFNPAISGTLAVLENLKEQFNNHKPFFKYCRELGAVFEKALDGMLSKHGRGDERRELLCKISTDRELRRDLARCAHREFQSNDSSSDLLEPLYPVMIHHTRERATKNDNEDEEYGLGVDLEGAVPLPLFIVAVIDAFFDNDLFHATKLFMSNAHGSFGLCVVSSLDSQRQISIAARGQPISVAFYPKKGIVLYGSEQSATKAALGMEPLGNVDGRLDTCVTTLKHQGSVYTNSLRLDLDDLNGEVCLLDFGEAKFGEDNSPVSRPNRNLPVHKRFMNDIRLVLWNQNELPLSQDALYRRCILLEGNDFIRPLKPDPKDVVLSDIRSIPRICQELQEDWQNKGSSISFNRLTALSLSRSLIRRFEALENGTIQRQAGTVDILFTGCEVSLWLAEQVASDLQKALTKLNIMAVSSNKLLGLFGQEHHIPAMGFGMSSRTHVLTDTIVIIVSHSGATFGPLAVSNLLQSATRDIYVVTSDWDTQIGKQLRGLYDAKINIAHNSRVFTTGVGFAPAEPASVSVAATQQLLTLLFEHICAIVIGNPGRRRTAGAVITARDLEILERCNQDCIMALQEIVGVNSIGSQLEEADVDKGNELGAMGDYWSGHVLENARAYVMSFLYIVFTVTTGWPLFGGIGQAAGASKYEWLVYLLRFLDSLLYFWLPQVNITILRLLQGRSLLHRMGTRTVVIGDIPWVAQAAEAFLSKMFACSYSIAGINVLSGNPADHLVHRHTHKIVRGTLVLCGRPDGRLLSLTSNESAVLLSVNQSSSIQSWGGKCESITIGHNPFSNPLCFHDIFLHRHRPLFLCERVLDMPATDDISDSLRKALTRKRISNNKSAEASSALIMNDSSHTIAGKYSTLEHERKRSTQKRKQKRLRTSIGLGQRVIAKAAETLETQRLIHHNNQMNKIGNDKSGNTRRSSFQILRPKRSGSNLLDLSKHSGSALDISKHSIFSFGLESGSLSADSSRHITGTQEPYVSSTSRAPEIEAESNIKTIIDSIKSEGGEVSELFKLFSEHANEDGELGPDEFFKAYAFIDPQVSQAEVMNLFHEADFDGAGSIDFEEFLSLTTSPHLKLQAMKQINFRDKNNSLVQIKPAEGPFFDDDLYRMEIPGVSKIAIAKSESLSMELYEARIASLQRFVAMTVLFHQMAWRVESFFSTISFGMWGYRTDRTHSMLRVATTASPTSGAHVRKQMQVLKLVTRLNRASDIIAAAWKRYKDRRILQALELWKESSSFLHDSSSRLVHRTSSIQSTVPSSLSQSSSHHDSILKECYNKSVLVAVADSADASLKNAKSHQEVDLFDSSYRFELPAPQKNLKMVTNTDNDDSCSC